MDRRAGAVKTAWRFEPAEPLDQAFRRVATEEIRAARIALTELQDGRDKAIHEARRSFKRLRALLRLASPAMDGGFAKENRRLRDAGRLLAPARDAAVLLDSFDRFVEAHAAGLAPADLASLRDRLAQKQPAPAADGKVVDAHVARVIALTERSERNLARLDWPADSGELQRGLRKAQARLKASFRAARETSDPEDLHDWRKRIKDQTAQMELFGAMLPGDLKAGRKGAKDIAQILGDEHDLCLLGARLSTLRVPGKLRDVRDRLVERIEARRKKLRQKVFRLGEAVSSREADGFARDLCAAWDATRA